jgi:hypothetical protein
MLLDKGSYRAWTAPFIEGIEAEGSDYIGDWNEGSKILFVSSGKQGTMGMVARIKESRPFDFISIEHVGIVKNGVEDTTSDEVKRWTPAFENYTFTEKDGGTEVSVDIDVADEFKTMFQEKWPKALQKLKELAEQ